MPQLSKRQTNGQIPQRNSPRKVKGKSRKVAPEIAGTTNQKTKDRLQDTQIFSERKATGERSRGHEKKTKARGKTGWIHRMPGVWKIC